MGNKPWFIRGGYNITIHARRRFVERSNHQVTDKRKANNNEVKRVIRRLIRDGEEVESPFLPIPRVVKLSYKGAKGRHTTLYALLSTTIKKIHRGADWTVVTFYTEEMFQNRMDPQPELEELEE